MHTERPHRPGCPLVAGQHRLGCPAQMAEVAGESSPQTSARRGVSASTLTSAGREIKAYALREQQMSQSSGGPAPGKRAFFCSACLQGFTTASSGFRHRRRVCTQRKLAMWMEPCPPGGPAVCSGEQIGRMLVTAGFARALELGIVRGLTPAFLLSLIADSKGQPQSQLLELSAFQRSPAVRSFHVEVLAWIVRESPQRLDGKEWIEAVAKADAPVQMIDKIAKHWQIPVPFPFDSWDSYSRFAYDVETISADVLRWHSGNPDAPVPLAQVWPLVRRYVKEPFFAQVLNDEARGERLQGTVGLEGNGVFALLSQARASGADGLGWAQLERLAAGQCIEPGFIRSLQAGGRAVEMVSRPLSSSDLQTLAVERLRGEAEAVEMAALLGIGCDYADLRSGFVGRLPDTDRASHIWSNINRRAPGLETAHFVELLPELGRRDLVARLVGEADSHFLPAVPLVQVCPRAPQFISLARQIRREPVAMLKFMARNNLAGQPGHCAPPRSLLAYRLLNSLALDPCLLESFHRFMQECRAATPPRLMEKSHAGFPCDYGCPITLDYMKEPVPTLGDGERVIYFEKEALLQALQQYPYHPMTKGPLSPDDVRGLDVDMAHLRRIHQWRQAHPELEPDGVPFVPPAVV